MPSLGTPNNTITNTRANGPGHNLTISADQVTSANEVPTVPASNAADPSRNVSRPNATSVLLHATTYEAKLLHRLNEIEDLIRRIPGMATQIKKV